MGPLRHMSLVISMCILTALAAVPRQSWGQQAERIGTVVAVDGSAEVCAANASPCENNANTWEPLQFRALLFPRDTVRTSSESKIKILLRDDSIMTLAENSRMEFTEFLLDQEKNQRRTVVSLGLGTLRVVTTKIFGAGSGTEVRTANTVAGVRGTTFVVIFIPPSTTQVLGLEGVVTVRNLNPAIPQIEPLQQNFRTLVVGNTAPGQAVPLPPAERQAVERDLRLIEQVPVEVQPSGERQSSGTIRGESSEEKQAERSGTPTPRTTAVPPAGDANGQDAEARLEQLLDQTRSVQNAQASEPPGLQGAQVITPDSVTSVNNLQSTQPSRLQLTITIPRN